MQQLQGKVGPVQKKKFAYSAHWRYRDQLNFPYYLVQFIR